MSEETAERKADNIKNVLAVNNEERHSDLGAIHAAIKSAIKILIAAVVPLMFTGVGMLVAGYYEQKAQNNSDTISDVFQKWAKRSPILATAFGVLMGHWFWD